MSNPDGGGPRWLARGRRLFTLVAWSILVGAAGTTAVAQPNDSSDRIADAFVRLAGPAGRVVRARCLAALPIEVEVGQGRVRATAYTFEVQETLKGSLSSTFTLRQVGRPEGGAADLGRLVGLPVYAPGVEYVLFLLPESGVGLTSPVDGAAGAFVVSGDRMLGMGRSHAVPARPSDPSSLLSSGASYAALRRAVRAPESK